MKWDDILSSFQLLAKGQGLYGRVLKAIYEMSYSELDSFKQYMEAQNFKNMLELVLFIEEGKQL